MSSVFKHLAMYISIALMAGCATFTDHEAEMRNFINAGKCAHADHYAHQNFRDDYLSWQLGNVSLNCWKNRLTAVEHFREGAAANGRYSHLSLKALSALGEKSPIAAADIALKSCYNKAIEREKSCALTAYGGVNSIGAPIVRERQRACRNDRMVEEEHCMRMHKPELARQLGERSRPEPPPQPVRIIIQQPPRPIENRNACIQDGGSLYCPNHPSTRPMPPVYR